MHKFFLVASGKWQVESFGEALLPNIIELRKQKLLPRNISKMYKNIAELSFN